jgi:arabinan endo-1,5-alpha-L-arabinosidase
MMIKNVNSGLFLEIFNANTTTSGVVDQWASTGCTCQEWTLVSTGVSPYPAPLSVSGSGIFAHDPNMIKTTAGTYWLYGTHNTLAESTNRTSWTAQSAGDINPDFSWWHTINTTGTGGRTDIWAPNVMFANSKYYQYYSIPFEPHSGAQAVIALATSTSPNGPWTDAGQIIESCGTTSGCTNTYNAIDPASFIDSTGKWWMVFGSWNDGIHVLQLNATTGLRISSTSPLTTVAVRGTTAVSTGEEGAFIYPHGGMYYYFASINVCCNGVSSTYRTIVGRSSSPTGPYLDKGGLALTSSGGTILISSHGNVNGPGGESVLTDGANSILVYHYYDGNNNGTPTLGLNTITWGSDGWPTIQ